MGIPAARTNLLGDYFTKNLIIRGLAPSGASDSADRPRA